MDAVRAKRLNYKDKIKVLEGNNYIAGIVVDRSLSVSPIHKTSKGIEYVWVLVRTDIGTAIYPSTRIL